MRTINDMISELQKTQVITIPKNKKDLIPDLVFTLDVMCLQYCRRDIETLSGDTQTRISLRC